MTQITVAGNDFPVGITSQTARPALADDNYERYPEQRYFSMQFNPLSSGAGMPYRRRTNEIQVLFDTPLLSQSPSYRRETSEHAMPEAINFFLERQTELVDNKPATMETQSKRARPLFLRPITLSDNSKHVVGDNGLRRFEEFKSYPDGWDYGRGSALSAGSVRLLNSFLKDLPELGAYEPSLFLTNQGNLQLGWEDVHGDVVEIEFFRNRIEYYVEALNEEGSVGVQDQPQLVRKIRSTIEINASP